MSTTIEQTPQQYDLTPAQHLLFYALKFTLHKQFVNIPIAIEMDASIDPELLRQAILQAVSRNDSFGIRFVKADKEWKQYFGERQLASLDTVDFSGKTSQHMDDHFKKIAQKVMKIENVPMTSMLIYRSPEGNTGIFSVFNHLAADFWAISLFLKDAMGIYFALTGQDKMPEEPRRFEVALQKELAYLNSPQYQTDVDFWKTELTEQAKDAHYTSVNGIEVLEKIRQKKKDPTYRFGSALYLQTKAAHEVLTIDRALVNQVKAFCEKSHFPSMALLFYLGYRTFISKVNLNKSKILCNWIIARRSTLDEKLSGGTRAQAIPFATDLDGNLTFLQALELMLEKQNELYRHANISPEITLALEKKMAGMKPIESLRGGLAYSYQPVPQEVGHGVRISAKWYSNGASPQPLYITVMDGGDKAGDMRVYYEYMIKQVTPERIREFHDYMLKVVQAGIDNPAISIKELLEL